MFLKLSKMKKLLKKNISDTKKIKKIVKSLREKKKIIGLCHGVFDLIHLGHLKHFEYAKNKSDILIVSITADKFIKKGPGRPIFDQVQRMEALSAIKYIDYIFLNDSATAINSINLVKPNYYFKGIDYKKDSLDLTNKIKIEREIVKKNKGVTIITNTKKFSSSNLINKSFKVLNDEQKKFLDKIKKNTNFSKIKKDIEDIFHAKPLVIGETILDEYIFCEALGKSGKEPVLAIRDLYNEKYLGGAGAITKNVSSFVKKILFLTMIGEKSENLHFIKKNLPRNCSNFFIKKYKSPTIIKKRYIDNVSKHKILGVYTLNDSLMSKKNNETFIKKIKQLSKKSNVTIISDYGHGLIDNNSAKIIKKYSKFCCVNVQVNAANIGHHTLRNYKNIALMITNENEIRHEMRSKTEKLENLMKKLSQKMNLKILIVTRGANGCLALNKKNNKFYYCPAFAQTVIDKIGAGDTMLSIISVLLSKKIDINLSLFIASLCAAKSVQTMGNKESIDKNTLLKEIEHIML